MRTHGKITLFLAAIALLGFLAGPALATDYFVRPDGSDANTGLGNTTALAFKTIQKAIDTASSGDTVYVASGTYVEQLTIKDKSLDIRGGIAMPGIPAGTTAVEMPVSRSLDVTKKDGVGNQADPLIWCEDTTPATASVTVNLYDLKVDGESRFVLSTKIQFLGIMFKNCTGSAVRCLVEDFQESPLGANPGCLGITIDGSSTYFNAINVTIYDCTVRNVQKAGIAVFEGTAHIRNCKIFGYGPTAATIQYGIQFGPGCPGATAGSIHGNVVSGFEYGSASYSAAGVVIVGCTGRLDASANNVSACDVGFYITGKAPLIGTHILNYNTVTNYKYEGIFTEAEGTGTYTGNRFIGSRPGSGAAWDDGPATPLKNLWNGNFYYDVTVPGARPVPGYAANSDAAAKPAPVPFGAGNNLFASALDPRGIEAGDLNGDGKLDLAWVDYLGDTITVQYGNGTGGWAGAQVLIMPTGSKPVALAIGELNGAAGLDLAAVCENGKIVIALNNGGPSLYNRFPLFLPNATLTGTTMTGSQKPSDIAAGDVDGSSNDDLLVSMAGNSTLVIPGGARLFKNSGTGLAYTGSNPFGVITSSYGCDLADLDGDSDLDAVVADAGLTSPTTTLNVKTYTNVLGLFSAGPVLTSGKSPRGLTCADLDKDGLSEIVVANYGNPAGFELGTVSVFQNRTAGGAPTFAAAVNTTADYGTLNVAVGDAFGDDDACGHLDVCAVNFTNGKITVLTDWRALTGVGGAFGATGSLTGPTNPLGGIVMGDLNNDSADDLFVTDVAPDKIVHYPGVVAGLLRYYGHGCAGYLDRIPVISAEGGGPNQPNVLFAIALRNARPSSGAMLVGSLIKVNPVPKECGLLFAFVNLILPTFTNAAGEAKFPITVPGAPPLTGISLYWQWGVVDASGKFLGSVALSNGMETKIGN